MLIRDRLGYLLEAINNKRKAYISYCSDAIRGEEIERREAIIDVSKGSNSIFIRAVFNGAVLNSYSQSKEFRLYVDDVMVGSSIVNIQFPEYYIFVVWEVNVTL